MPEPRVPGGDAGVIELPCGETARPHVFDLGMREYQCDCGERHAVVMDVHPPARFVPEFLVEVLREIVDTEDGFGEFGTPHLLGAVLEEFPDEVVVHDAAEDGSVGYAMLWVTDFDSRRLHEVVVELVVELMDHAVSHAEDDAQIAAFEEYLAEFDVAAFVEQYRAERDLESERDAAI